jgi:serine/threonine protein kinase/WD40 repeat protein
MEIPTMTERALFLAALEIGDPAERAAHLDRSCNGDSALRARIEQQLQAHQTANGCKKQQAFSPVVTIEDHGDSERPGTLIGPYKLLEQIGEGGFGVVYLAEQQRPVRRKVAVKVLKPGMDTRQVVARFEAERQALALMDHPNIARVLDAGASDAGRPYFVMELVRGIPITDYCDQNNLSVHQRLELFVSVCQAVQHAHQKGIIHRDLKPSNLLVTLLDGTPVVKVIDFGIAKALGQQLTDKTLFTVCAQMIGTPLYMSPEQAEMNGLDTDTRSDIYSLGVLLYELLTGTTPLVKERVSHLAYDELRRLIREEEPPRPSTRLSALGPAATRVSAQRQTDPKKLRQLVRGELGWIVMKALEKDRGRRYETAGAFAADIQRHLHDEPVQACPPSAWYRFGKFARRHKRALATGSVLAVALLGSVVALAVSNVLVSRESAQKALALQGKDSATVAAKASARDATEQLFQALLQQARAGRYSRQMGQRLDSLDALAKAAHIHPCGRLRAEAIAALALPDLRRGPSWHGWPAGTQAWAFDAQYRTYARAGKGGIISVRSIPDDQEIRRIVSAPTTVGYLLLSPDGRYVARFEDGNTVQVWRVSDGQPILAQKPCPAWGLAFSPDSRQLVVGQQGWILRFDLATGQELNRWSLPGKAKAHGLAFHPDNRRLAVGYYSAAIVSIYDATNGKLATHLPVGVVGSALVAWHPGGERLAVTGSDPRIQIWDVAAKRRLATLEGHVQPVTALTFHPAGGLLASTSWDGTLRLWDPATGRQLMQLPRLVYPAFSSDGRWLGVVMQGEQAQLLEVTPGREYRTLVSSLGAGQGDYHEGDISPDGRLLALKMWKHSIHLWHLASGREVAVLPPGIPVFQPEGRELLTCSRGGLNRWPIQDGGEQGKALRLGPPQTIPLPVVPTRAVCSQDGRTLALFSEEAGKGLLMDLATNSVRAPLLEHPQACFIALSPDGRWAATSGWHSDRARLWNARTGKMVHEWTLGLSLEVFFTLDSRTLIISRGDEFSFWDVETLKPIRRLRREVAHYPGYVAFSPDGKLMALEMAPAVIHLKEVATGRLVAKLEDPNGDRAGWLGFTPDGTQLVVGAPYARAVHIWDLRLIRQRLKTMGLDWNWPAFPPADPASKGSRPVKIAVILGDSVESVLTREQKARQAIERFRLALAASPNNADACNNLAWAYLTAPEALQDAKAALPLAEKAVRLASGNANYRNTLGLAYYRAGRFREAVETLRPNLKTQENWGLTFDLYFLAMSHQRLGETARAQDYYDLAIRWSGAQHGLAASYVEELSLFRAEAEKLLGIDRKKN